MKIKTYAYQIVFLVLAVFLLSAAGLADDIKARMKARLPVIVELKAKGIVGENADGFLGFVGNKKEKEDVVAAENSDRMKVYTDIAQQTGTTAEIVGKRRALQIAEKAGPGEWLQDVSDKWYQKK